MKMHEHEFDDMQVCLVCGRNRIDLENEIEKFLDMHPCKYDKEEWEDVGFVKLCFSPDYNYPCIKNASLCKGYRTPHKSLKELRDEQMNEACLSERSPDGWHQFEFVHWCYCSPACEDNVHRKCRFCGRYEVNIPVENEEKKVI